jgi:hypothetical protein
LQQRSLSPALLLSESNKVQLKPDVEKVGHSYGFMMDYPKLLTGFYFCLVLGIFRRDEKLAEIGKGKIVGYIAGFVFSVI